MSTLRIALAQCRQTADLDTNAATIFRMVEDAARQGVQILCFPETQTVGYRVDISTPDRPVPVEWLAELESRLAKRCAAAGMACILGTETPLESDPYRGKPHNSALVISERGQVRPPQDAAHAPRCARVHARPRLPDLRPLRGPGRRRHLLRGASVPGVDAGMRPPGRPGHLPSPEQHHAGERLEGARAPRHDRHPGRREHRLVRVLPHQNSRSLIVAPDGQIWAQTELRREELLVADLDVARATRAMFEFERGGMADVLFGTSVRPEEFAAAGPMRS